jgi:hypothetical protein
MHEVVKSPKIATTQKAINFSHVNGGSLYIKAFVPLLLREKLLFHYATRIL